MRIGVPLLGAYATDYFLSRLSEIQGIEVQGFEFPFEEINECLPDNFSCLKPLLENAFDEIDPSSYDIMLIPNITIHEAIEKYVDMDKYKILHPLKVLENIGLSAKIIATTYTMEGKYLKSKVQGLTSPSFEDRLIIDEQRIEIYKTGTCDFVRLNAVLRKYDQVLLACTEFSVVRKHISHPRCMDVLEKLIQAALSPNTMNGNL